VIRFKVREWNIEGYRPCSWCGAPIGQCMGSIVAGDMILAWRGQLDVRKVRERCGRCAMRYVAARNGSRGLRERLMAIAQDAFRWISWHLQYRLRRRFRVFF
jgi:hypothetical protein